MNRSSPYSGWLINPGRSGNYLPFPIPLHKSHLVKTVISKLTQNILTQSLMDWLLLWSSLLMCWIKKIIEPSSLSLFELLLLKYASTINRKLDMVKASDSININIIVTVILYCPAHRIGRMGRKEGRSGPCYQRQPGQCFFRQPCSQL